MSHPTQTDFRATCPRCGEIAKPGRKRCAICRAPLYPADSFLAALRAGKIQWGVVNADDPRHGTENGYRNQACRCDRCREAHRIHWTERAHATGRHRPREQYLADRRANPPPHGTELRYGRSWRCRCDECRAAATEARRRRRQRLAA